MGYTDLLVNNRSQAPVQELEAAGAKGATQQEIGAQCDVVITILAFGSNGEFYMVEEDEMERGLKIMVDEADLR